MDGYRSIEISIDVVCLLGDREDPNEVLENLSMHPSAYLYVYL